MNARTHKILAARQHSAAAMAQLDKAIRRGSLNEANARFTLAKSLARAAHAVQREVLNWGRV